LATEADQVARFSANSESQTQALGAVAQGLAQAGEWERAQATALNITDPNVRSQAFTAVAQTLAIADPERAVAMANDTVQAALMRSSSRAWMLASIAQALAAAHPKRALALVTEAEQAARTSLSPNTRTRALLAVAQALATADAKPELTLTTEAEWMAGARTNLGSHIQVHRVIADTSTAASTVDRVARDKSRRVGASRLVAEVLAGEEWWKAIQLLSELNPPSVVAIYEALQALAAE
jgi:hypothetical protein